MTDGDASATGRQYEIGFGGHRAVVTGDGATLRACTLDGRDVIRSFPADRRSPAGHGQVLAPWPNRLRGGRYQWEGRTLQLPLTEPARGNAIHGLVRWEDWTATEVAADRVQLRYRIHPRDGYPFLVDLEVTYALSARGLTVEARAANPGSDRAPFGMGFHPYLLAGDGGGGAGGDGVGGEVDDWTLTVPARTRLLADDSGIPISSTPVDGTEFDFRTGRAIGPLVLDTAFTDLDREADGHAIVVVRARTGADDDADGGTDDGTEDRRPSTTLWVDGSFSCLMVFTGDTLDRELRRRAVAVEPMTCPPNALATGEDLVVLEPGGQWEGRWGISSEPQDRPYR